MNHHWMKLHYHCRFCGARAEHPICEDCYAERCCEGCFQIYEGENPTDGMRLGCHDEGTIGVPCEEDTLCNECWLERQPPLFQIAGALLE